MDRGERLLKGKEGWYVLHKLLFIEILTIIYRLANIHKLISIHPRAWVIAEY